MLFYPVISASMKVEDSSTTHPMLSLKLKLEGRELNELMVWGSGMARQLYIRTAVPDLFKQQGDQDGKSTKGRWIPISKLGKPWPWISFPAPPRFKWPSFATFNWSGKRKPVSVWLTLSKPVHLCGAILQWRSTRLSQNVRLPKYCKAISRFGQIFLHIQHSHVTSVPTLGVMKFCHTVRICMIYARYQMQQVSCNISRVSRHRPPVNPRPTKF